MKRLVVSAFAVLATLGTSAVPAFADVLRDGSTGQPYAVVSNPGSTQGQLHRSDTGTYNKFTHDGFMPVIN
jgi:hypothetical protein